MTTNQTIFSNCPQQTYPNQSITQSNLNIMETIWSDQTVPEGNRARRENNVKEIDTSKKINAAAANEDAIKAPVKHPEAIDAIISLLSGLINVECIYRIGYSISSALHDGLFKSNLCSQHFELLVITQLPGDIEVLDLQRTINDNKDINASVTLLLHSKENVIEALKDNNRFFNGILRSGNLIYQQEGLSWGLDLPHYDGSRELSDARLSWYHRQQRAEALMVAAANITEDETGIVEAWLFNQAMEQVCLGFIFVSIGYKPNQPSLSYLFEICRCINPAIEEVFPTAGPDDKAIFNLLVASVESIRYQIVISIHPTDLGLLHRRCCSWMEKAAELIGSL